VGDRCKRLVTLSSSITGPRRHLNGLPLRWPLPIELTRMTANGADWQFAAARRSVGSWGEPDIGRRRPVRHAKWPYGVRENREALDRLLSDARAQVIGSWQLTAEPFFA
jgi:hypothetical protein